MKRMTVLTGLTLLTSGFLVSCDGGKEARVRALEGEVKVLKRDLATAEKKLAAAQKKVAGKVFEQVETTQNDAEALTLVLGRINELKVEMAAVKAGSGGDPLSEAGKRNTQDLIRIVRETEFLKALTQKLKGE